MRTLIVFLLLSGIVACSPQTSTESTAGLDSITIARDNNIATFQGLYVNGKFISCDNPRIIYSVDNKKRELDSIYKQLLPNAYSQQTIFLEVKGSMPEDKAKDILIIEQVLRTGLKDQNNTCVPYEYWCHGTEPFWQVEISRSEDLIDYFDPMEQKTMHFSWHEPKIEKDKIVYTSGNDTSGIMVVLRNEFCKDGMAEKKYNFSAEVLIGGKNLKGCAIRYDEPRE
jgi:uncharacterized membrane protein